MLEAMEQRHLSSPPQQVDNIAQTASTTDAVQIVDNLEQQQAFIQQQPLHIQSSVTTQLSSMPMQQSSLSNGNISNQTSTFVPTIQTNHIVPQAPIQQQQHPQQHFQQQFPQQQFQQQPYRQSIPLTQQPQQNHQSNSTIQHQQQTNQPQTTQSYPQQQQQQQQPQIQPIQSMQQSNQQPQFQSTPAPTIHPPTIQPINYSTTPMQAPPPRTPSQSTSQQTSSTTSSRPPSHTSPIKPEQPIKRIRHNPIDNKGFQVPRRIPNNNNNNAQPQSYVDASVNLIDSSTPSPSLVTASPSQLPGFTSAVNTIDRS